MRFSIFLVFGLCLAVNQLSFASKVIQTKQAAIKELIQLTVKTEIKAILSKGHVGATLEKWQKQFPQLQRKHYNIIAHEVVISIEREMQQNPSFYSELIPIYEKYFTHEEIELILEFYRSDIGKKLAKNQLNFDKDILITSSKWSKSISRAIHDSVVTRMKLEGHLSDTKTP